MLKSIFTNFFGILTSRILGFFRDVLIASILGANIFSDIFFVAFKFPNLFRRIFAEGAFSQTFIPSLTHSKRKALFAIRVLFSFSIFIITLTLIVQLFPKQVTSLIAFGFDKKVQYLAAPFVAINFYYLILIFWVTFLTAILHYKQHFATSAFSTALLNCSLIVALLLSKDRSSSVIVTFLSFGVIMGGILQLFAHIIAIRTLKYHKFLCIGLKHYKIKKKLTNDTFNHFKNNFFPAVWGNSTAQLAAFIDTALASFLIMGSISYLYYANRIFQLPLALFAIATTLVVFPKITKALKNSNEVLAINHLNRAFWLLFPLLTLSVIGGITLHEEIVWLLFERGAFTKIDRIITSTIFILYMIGLLPFGVAKLFSLWLYAKQEQKKAAKIATWSLLFNILLSLILIFPFKIYGLAMASTMSGFITLILTIKAFGVKSFLAIILDIKSFYLFLASIVIFFISLGIKDLFSVYL